MSIVKPSTSTSVIPRIGMSALFTLWCGPGDTDYPSTNRLRAVPFGDRAGFARRGINTRVSSDLAIRERRCAMATLDWSGCPAVESVPRRLSGAWVFRGTRMPASAVFENIEAGASIDEIVEQFDVSREQINAV